MPKIFRVTGDSMYPTLSNNDILVTCKKKIRAGDIVVLNLPRFGRVVKRINSLGDGSCTLIGDNLSERSRCCSTAQNTENIIGCVVLTVRTGAMSVYKNSWIRKFKRFKRLLLIYVNPQNSDAKS
jgi:phage repressor protein C with HTH and peptisase S24 domain